MRNKALTVRLILLLVFVGIAGYFLYYSPAQVDIKTLEGEVEKANKELNEAMEDFKFIKTYHTTEAAKKDNFLYEWFNDLFPNEVLEEDLTINVIKEVTEKEEEGYNKIDIKDIKFGAKVLSTSETAELYEGMANFIQFNTEFTTTYKSLQIFLDNIRKNMPKIVIANLTITDSKMVDLSGEPLLDVTITFNALSSSSENKKVGSKYRPITKGNETSKNNIFLDISNYLADKEISTYVTPYDLQLNKEIQQSNLKRLNYSKSDFYVALNTQEVGESDELPLPAVIVGKTSSGGKSLFGDASEHNIEIEFTKNDKGSYDFHYSMDGKEKYPTKAEKEKFVPVNSDKIVVEILCNQLNVDENTKVNVKINNNTGADDGESFVPVEYKITGDRNRVSVERTEGVSEM